MKPEIQNTKQLFILLLTVFVCVRSSAQQYRIIPFAGYTLKETFDFAGKRAVINPGAHFGGILEYRIKTNYSIELMFQYQEPGTEFSDSVSHRTVNTAISYYMFGGLNYYRFGQSRFSSIAGLYVGIGNVANQDNNSNAARFAAGLKAGVLCDITRSIGIRLQSQVLLMLGGPGSVWGYDNVGTYGPIMQAGFSGGIVFSFGKKQLSNPGDDS